MAKQWYIVHTYSGHEAKAMRALLERAKSMGREADFDEVLIPEETVVEMVKGQKRTSKRKYFPGYILVRMELNDETWHVVTGTAKVTGFVGGGQNPPAIPDEEVAKITNRMEEGVEKPKPKVESCFMHISFPKIPKYTCGDTALLFKVIRTAFGQRRKTILNSLSKLMDKKDLQRIFEEAELGEKLRAENLTIENYIALTNAIKNFI